MPSRIKPGWKWLWLVGYVVVIAAVVITLQVSRTSVLKQLGTPEAHDDWQTWKQDTRHPPASFWPVVRREQPSDEPPMLVLMRDYFGVMLTGAVTAISLLYGFFAFTISGVWHNAQARRRVGE